MKQLVADLKTVMGDRDRRSLKYELEVGREERELMEESQRTSSRDLIVSGFALGLAMLGTINPIFRILAIPAVLYVSRDVFIVGYRDLRRGHYISLYVESAVIILGMIAINAMVLAAIVGLIYGLFSKIVQRVESNSKDSLVRVFCSQPKRVWILVDQQEVEVDFKDIVAGEQVIVNAGEIIPVDGIVVSGLGQVDQHLLTGESLPVDKEAGEPVFASTLLIVGRLIIEVKTAGEETTAARIGRVLNDTQTYKDTLISRGRLIADRFLPLSYTLAAVTLPLLGPKAAIAVLWADLGSNMSTMGPLNLVTYLQILSRRNILIKDGRVLECLRKVDTVIFDKTGTLTREYPTIRCIHAIGDVSETEVLRLAGAAEYRQSHPLARAILADVQIQGLTLPEIAEAEYEVGYGISVCIRGERVRVGSERYIRREGISISADVEPIVKEADEKCNSLVYVARNNNLVGILEFERSIRPEAEATIRFLKKRGYALWVISGDSERPTRRLAETLGIDNFIAETLPEEKAERVKEICDAGRFVCFIGDGINDAVALKSAQVSISLKGASTAATDTAQIILMDGTLNKLKFLFECSDTYEQAIRANLLWSFGPSIVTIGGIYLFHFGIGTAMSLYCVSCIGGLGTTLWPLVEHQKTNQIELQTMRKTEIADGRCA